MVWDASVNGTSLEALVTIPSQIDDKCQEDDIFRVCFQLKKEYLDQLTLKPNDKFRLSLRGARLKKLSEIQKASTIAMELRFSDGLLIQWKSRDGELKAMNTWIGMCLSRNYTAWFYHVGLAHEIIKDDDNSWFSSPRKTERPSISQQVPTKRSHDDIDGDNESNSASSVKNKAMKLSHQEKKRLREQGRKAKTAKNMDNESLDARLPILQTKDTNDTIAKSDEVTAKASVIRDSAEDERDKAPKKPGAEALKSVS
jgi:hypothetical protein